MYGSIEGVKDNLPRFAEYIKEDAAATGRLDIKESTVTGYLTEFSAVVDNALYNSYIIPLQDANGNTPPVINLIVNNLAAYKLASRFHSTLSNEENHSIMALRKDANEMIKSLVMGDYGLPGVARAAAVTGDAELDEILATDGDEYFTMEDPTAWQDKI
jgi:phage gp36-like protein